MTMVVIGGKVTAVLGEREIRCHVESVLEKHKRSIVTSRIVSEDPEHLLALQTNNQLLPASVLAGKSRAAYRQPAQDYGSST